jgi:hypothetical protein
MIQVRKEVKDYICYTDLLLDSASTGKPLTEMERGLLEAYVMRLWEELKLSVDPPFNWDQSQPDRRHRAVPGDGQASA